MSADKTTHNKIKPISVITCIKQVPGTTEVEIDDETGNLKRDGIESKMNMYDLFSIEAALSLTEKYGGSVRVLSMGPPQAGSVLREALYMGADTGTLVSDRRFAGSDVLATAYTLSQAVMCLGDYDLILCGKQTTDGDTAQVGAELAEFLGIPHASAVISIEPDNKNKVTVRLNQDDRIAVKNSGCDAVVLRTSDLHFYDIFRKKMGVSD